MPEIPSVSVLIPTYNYARFLPTAIESVLSQDFTDFELIVSDDASSDGSAEVIRRYAERDRRIRVHIHESNVGMVGNWNWSLRQARGTYVKFLFADDCLAFRHSLGRLVSHLEDNPGAVLAASARLVIDEESRPVGIWNHLQTPGLLQGRDVVARCLWNDGNLIGEPSAVLFRRAPAGRGFDPQLKQLVDLEFWFHLLLTGDLVFDPEPLCSFRVHSGQQTVQNRQSHVGPEESLRITSRYLEFLCSGAGNHLTTFQRMRILHRCLHYSRKRVARAPNVVSAEAELDARLPRGWRMLCWMAHRSSKPFENLVRFVRRDLRTREPTPVPAALYAWRPPRE
jgi:hypothetical protein